MLYMDNGYMLIKHGNNPLYMEVSMDSYILYYIYMD